MTSDLVACTIVSRRYVAMARVLADSIRRHAPHVRFVVLLADQYDHDVVDTRRYDLLQLDAVEPAQHMTFRHRPQDLSYALTPFLLRHLLASGASRVVFLKQETLLFDGLDAIFEQLERHSLLVCPHLLEPPLGDTVDRELTILQSGLFNVGLLGAASSALPFLDWWAERVALDCRHDIAHGIHYEQRWLDLAPCFVEDIHIARQPWLNVGHWALPDVTVEVRDDRPFVQGNPVVAFRFSGFDAMTEQRAPTRYSSRLDRASIGDVTDIFDEYATRLSAEQHVAWQQRPDGFANFDDGEPIADVMRDIHRSLPNAEVEKFGDPFAVGADSYAEWLTTVDESFPGHARIWKHVYETRPDVRRAFPDPVGTDAAAFTAWCDRFGTSEYGIGARAMVGRRS